MPSLVLFEHDLLIVGVAGAIVMIFGWMLQPLLQRSVEASSDVAAYWIALTGVVGGGSVWSVHFIAMLGYRPLHPVAYLQGPTLASLGIACGAMAVVAIIARWLKRRAIAPLMGVLFVGSVSWMHYTGMSAMTCMEIYDWNLPLIGASVLLAAILATIAMKRVLTRHSDAPEAASTALIAASVLSVHFGGMLAMSHTGTPDPVPAGAMTPDVLLLPVLSVTALIVTLGYFGYILDSRKDRLLRTEAMRLRNTNHLTGLANEAGLVQRAQQLADDDTPFDICGFSIARYMRIRTAHGDDVAQRVLKVLADRLSEAFSDGFVAQGNEDRFYVLTPRQGDTDPAIAARVLSVFKAPIAVEDSSITLAPCIGSTSWPRACADPKGLLPGLEFAIDQATESGPGAVSGFDDKDMGDLRYRSRLALDLETAIGSDQLELFYQPQVALGLSPVEVTGFEALLRWRHPELGMIRPDTFIPLAQENGLICELGEWVLHRACRDAARWNRPLSVAVNVDPLQLRNRDFVKTVHHALRTSGLSPTRLEIEVTETGIIEDLALAETVLDEVRALGVRTALDDYGAGYSSMKTLYHVAFDTLKLDRAFISDIETDQRSRRIVQAVGQMGRTLGMILLAEGIETQSQADAAREEGFQMAQGYHFAKPMPLAEVERLYDLKQKQMRA